MAKPIFNFAHICENASITSDGRVNILGIFTSIIASSKLFVYGPFSVVFNFTPGDKNPHELKILIRSLSNEDIFNFDDKIGPATDDNSALGYILNIRRVKLEEEGEHFIVFYVDNNLIHKLSFNFIVKTK